MSARLALITLVLVILPTAVLTFIAARALWNWELVVERRFEINAVDAIRGVTKRVEARLDDELEHIRAAVEETLLRRPAIEEIRNTAARLRQTRPLVREVFVFMNPWGFMHPEGMETREFRPRFSEPDDLRRALEGRPRREWSGDVRTAETRSGWNVQEVEVFVGALRREIASAPHGETPVRLALSRAAYCFAPLKGWKGVYVGYEVDRAEFTKTLQQILSGFSGGGIRLMARGPGFEDTRPSTAVPDVVVSDSFSPDGKAVAGESALNGIRDRLAESSLAPPFDSVRIIACAEDPERVVRFSSQQVRLHAWAVALLAGGIVAGVWLLIRETASEIRHVRARSDFVIGVSHDLRTPVASVKMLAETLCAGRIADPQTARKFLGVIAREADRLNQLIERVLYFVRFDQDAIEHAPQPTEIGRFVKEVVESFLARYTVAAEGGETVYGSNPVSLHVVGDLPLVALDEGAMTQVLLNLLDNAVKYVRPEVPARVEIDVRCATSPWWLPRKKNLVVISVRDNGIGISRRDQRRIFRRYYRTQEARRSNVSGVGLGLAMCRHIVKMHGGWIRVESKPGEGSTFSVYLPAVGECGQGNAT